MTREEFKKIVWKCIDKMADRLEKELSEKKPRKECKHKTGPKELQAWERWCEKMNKTHRQIKCPDCGLWYWIPRKELKGKEK